MMARQPVSRITHSDIELMKARIALSPGQRLAAMFDARALMVGLIRGRLRQQYPDLSEAELNLKMLEEIERAQSIRRPQSIPRHSA